MAKPIIKWVGGKTQLLPELVKRLPLDFPQLHYVEPFFGGGALFFHLQPTSATINDHNVHLIQMYEVVRRHSGAVVEALDWFETLHNKGAGDELYYNARSVWNTFIGASTTCTRPAMLKLIEQDRTGARAAALFIYLNKTCFNGIYRVNKEGAFNVPAGKYERPRKITDAVALEAAAAALQNAEIKQGDYHAVRPTRPSFFYVDPPYAPASTTANFTGYTANGFDHEDQRDLKIWLSALHMLGHKWMLSNNDVPAIRALYREFKIERVDARRTVNSKADKRGAVGEVLVTNY